MANTFAQLVLFSWPLVAILLFAAQRPARALAGAIVVGYLLLPANAGVNFPMIPAIDKELVINLTAAAVMALALRRQRQIVGSGTVQHPFGRATWLFSILIALTLATPLLTVLTNNEPVIAGPRYIPGLKLYDAASLTMSTGIAILPFVLGMRVLGTPEAQAELLRVLVVAGCAYALLALFEVRMSPQLSKWIYGYFPHAWSQHIRGGAFRPVVFLHHGLWLGIFLCMVLLAACTLWRQTRRDQPQAATRWMAATLWLATTLVLSRNLGATTLAMLFAPVVFFSPPRFQIIIAGVFASLVLTYPMLRGAGLVPTETIYSLAQSVSDERARSLKYRLDNEDMLLARAKEKPLTGWGSWGRNRVYDLETGRDLSTTDGIWVIIIGSYGWLGYLANFGLLTVPIFVLALRRDDMLTPATTGLAILTVAALIDLIPNATLTPVTWLVAGALAGYAVRRASTTPPNGRLAPFIVQAPKWTIAGSAGPLQPPPQSYSDRGSLMIPSKTHRRQPRI